MGRIRAAWQVLMGRQQTYPQIQAEWAEMKADWLSAFDKLNALVARMAKERKRLTESIAESHGVPPEGIQGQPEGGAPPQTRKQQLRSQAFGHLAGGRVGPGQNGPPEAAQAARSHDGMGRWVPVDEEEQDERPD